MSNSLQVFEDAYWRTGAQTEEFRHRQALAWLSTTDTPVLDIGCGDGFFLKQLQEKGIACWGIDISKVAIDVCLANGSTAEVADFASGEIPERPVHTAVILDVLEHMYDPLPLLNALHARIETLIISVPNFAALPARLQVLNGDVPENNTPRKGHVYWYTQRVLERRLKECGWRIETQAMNPPWRNKPVIGSLMRWLAKQSPSLFSLSLVVRAVRLDAKTDPKRP